MTKQKSKVSINTINEVMKTYKLLAIKIIFVLGLLTNTAFAQLSKEQKFISELFLKEKIRKITYTNKVWPYNIDEISSSLKYDTIKRNKRSSIISKEWVILSKGEKKFIEKEIKKYNEKSWAINKLPQYEYMHLDTLFTKKYRYWTSFTKPIFIRNNTMCFFYYDIADWGTFRLYIYQDGKWEYFSSLWEWVG